MNFFQHQDKARRKTGILIGLLAAAVITLIVITVLLVATSGYFMGMNSNSIDAVAAQNTPFITHLTNLLVSPLSLWVALAVVMVVAGGTLFKMIQVAKGGAYIAASLGGRLVNPDTTDADERKVLNVVEEMAIASGNPVPRVFLLDEGGINAFAAGKGRRDAVIGITRGAIRALSRDEIQGVVAHEFSHIHNGDMRLNMRILGILHGILMIGLVGEFMLRGWGYSSYGYSRRRSRSDGRLAALGFGLLIVGYGGTFFGNLIKAAVSRQREFLADASAVQFTRNPAGIGGALKKIGGAAGQSYLSHPSTSEFSHMYFGSGLRKAVSGMFATHPPLEQRIKRVEPGWDGQYPQVVIEEQTVSETAADKEDDRRTAAFTAVATATAVNASLGQAIEYTGTAAPEGIAAAHDLIAGLPATVYQASHEAFSARALVYCLLLDDEKALRRDQMAHLMQNAHPATMIEVNKLQGPTQSLTAEQRLPLLDLAIPALKSQSPRQRDVFTGNLVALIKADGKVSLFEWCLYRIVMQNLEERSPKERYHLSQVRESAEYMLQLVCSYGEDPNPQKAFACATEALPGLALSWKTVKLENSRANRAVSDLAQLRPLEKPKFLKSMAAAIECDGKVTPAEAELFRAIADLMDCPVPPLSGAGGASA